MRFASLGSGSRGNGTLIEADGTCLLVDCGFSIAETEHRLARLKRRPEDIDAILITHEHADHVRGVARFAARFNIPVRATAGTLAACGRYRIGVAEPFNAHEGFAIGGLEITPIAVPHDAREPTQFLFSDGARRLGLLTDSGHITAHITRTLSVCDALILECNHDEAMLVGGPYPPRLKQRVGGLLGHLSNAQAAGLLGGLDVSRLQHLVAAHLSEHNNTPVHARAALAEAVGCAAEWIAVADQEEGLDWRELLPAI
ncbi:MAG TPA: MBL fold metallo-hydrolase [Gammaproteobacteria bacterium]|nr:MBL fold metallo-hydrolase [Gammaproteobacteria bacterium]